MSRRLSSFAKITFVFLITFSLVSPINSQTLDLPQRNSPIPKTTNSVPHIQIGVEAIPEISMQLLNEISQIPDVIIIDSVISLPGAKGFWIKETVQLAHPEAIVSGREFAHIHPDGSLHISLPIELAQQAVEKGWATFHPWSKRKSFYQGFVMIYTPTTAKELEITLQLVLASYNYILNRNEILK